jgi:hypothetical protein
MTAADWVGVVVLGIGVLVFAVAVVVVVKGDDDT